MGLEQTYLPVERLQRYSSVAGHARETSAKSRPLSISRSSYRMSHNNLAEQALSIEFTIHSTS